MSTILTRFVGDWAVDRGVPLPSARAPKKMKYPFREMAVGESFALPIKKADNCRNAANLFCRRNQPTWKFSVNKVDEKEYRCWRVG